VRLDKNSHSCQLTKERCMLYNTYALSLEVRRGGGEWLAARASSPNKAAKPRRKAREALMVGCITPAALSAASTRVE
jgi:hypothetical protein